MQNKRNKKSSEKRGKNVGSLSYFLKKYVDSSLDLLKTMGFAKTTFILSNRTTFRFEAHLILKHTQKPDFLISNAR
jgi:hypothetical protein